MQKVDIEVQMIQMDVGNMDWRKRGERLRKYELCRSCRKWKRESSFLFRAKRSYDRKSVSCDKSLDGKSQKHTEAPWEGGKREGGGSLCS